MSAQVILHPRRARPFFGRHPWVFAGAIQRVEGSPSDGDVITLHTDTREYVATGLYNGQSNIRVRLYCWQPEQLIDDAFFRRKLQASIQLREDLHLISPTGACRLVNSEGDGLSGLVVDHFAGWVVVQFTSLALYLRRDLLCSLLNELLNPKGIHLRTERGIGKLEGMTAQDGPLTGEPPPSPLVIDQGGLRYSIDLAEGQKTGFYLDQRENRLAVAALARGRRVLDCFTYSGGFALHAAAAGATEVIGLDQSEPALKLARTNAELNGLPNIHFERAVVADALAERVQQGELFGMVILDPPKFARQRDGITEALHGYRRLQALALRMLEPGGILVMCCCSGLISMDMLEEVLANLAAEENREIQILARRGAALDHPVSVACRESHYLKFLILRVV